MRGLDGVDGEWITQKEFLSDAGSHALDGRKLSDDERIIQRMESLDRVLVSLAFYFVVTCSSQLLQLYVHGGVLFQFFGYIIKYNYTGGYFWGSISAF